MLILAHRFKDLRFRELMEVYDEDNRKKSETEWPELPPLFAREMAEQSFRQYLKEVFFPTPGALYALWEEQGHYVSALRMEPYRDGLLLAGLETAPEYRNQGHGKALILAVLEYLGQQGHKKIYSHVCKSNAPSRHLHESCGFLLHKDFAACIDGTVTHRAVTYLYGT